MENPTNPARRIDPCADMQDVIAAIGATSDAALAEDALLELCQGVVTGEGPTTRGRAHFSRTIDAEEVALCHRILVAAGNTKPVSRSEAEILFEIHDVALDREDGGRFDDLLVKAIAHYVVSATGREVPPREVALAPETPLANWAASKEANVADGEIAAWLASHVRATKHKSKHLNALMAMLAGASVTPVAMSLAAILDLMA